MSKHPCQDCEERHYACWDGYPKYQAIKNTQKVVDEAELYFKAKGAFYRTKYGWRR